MIEVIYGETDNILIVNGRKMTKFWTRKDYAGLSLGPALFSLYIYHGYRRVYEEKSKRRNGGG